MAKRKRQRLITDHILYMARRLEPFRNAKADVARDFLLAAGAALEAGDVESMEKVLNFIKGRSQWFLDGIAQSRQEGTLDPQYGSHPVPEAPTVIPETVVR